jgi:ABC-2 type transport system ATP-binding protein
MPAIEAKNIGRTFKTQIKKPGLKGALSLLIKPEYKTFEALKDISFEIEEGSFIGLIGANGAGKTTLLKILSGLIPPTSGSAKVLGYEPFKRNLNFRKQIALVMGQKAQLWWDLPAIDAFELIAAIYEIPKKEYNERINELSELLNVKKLLNTQIRRLSLGERMKMELIGALLHWPKIIFLDEPTIGLDVLAASNLREFLKNFNQKTKATIILTSHNMDDIEKLCSRVMILKSGSLIYDGSPHGLIKEGECTLRIQILETPKLDELGHTLQIDKEKINVNSENTQNNTFFIQTNKNLITQIIPKIIQNYTLIDMGIEEQSLESVIQRIYHEP